MKFRVLGYSKENGAKVQMEFEAQSKAEAERKAIKSHLEVVRVELSSEADVHNATLPSRPAGASPLAPTGVSSRPVVARTTPDKPRGGLTKILLLLLIAVAAYGIWSFWAQIVQTFDALKGR